MKERYESYKDSGVPWIGQVPQGWECVKLSQIAREHHISNKGINHQNLLSLSYGKVIRKDINTTDGLLPQSFDGYQIVEKGNIILRLTDLQNDHKSLRVGLVQEEGIITSAYLCLECSPMVLPEYLYMILHVNDIHKVFYGMGGGIRQSLNFDGIRSLPILLPPLSEQRAIAGYLDARCAAIDAYVASLEREANLALELKQAVIARAVTRGLDPNAPMRDSGIPWIGKVPQGWEVRRLKSICQIYGRIGFRGYNQSDLVGKGGGAITLSPSNMKDGKMDYTKCSYLSWEKYYESPEIMIENGNILFVKTASCGKVAFVSDLPMEATINPQIVVMKNIRCDTTYFMYVLCSELIQNQVKTSVNGGTIPTISQEKILSYKIPLPPLSEQRAIAGYLDARCAAIDAYVSSLEREATLARELKQREIADAVTGKVKITA